MKAPRLNDRVLACLVLVGAVGALAFGFVSHAPNRVADGVPHLLRQAPAVQQAMIAATLAALAALSLLPREKARAALALAGAVVLVFLCLVVVAGFADRLAEGAKPAARTSVGPGFFILATAALMIGLDAARRGRLGPWPGALAVGAAAAGIAVMSRLGLFANLSIAREFSANRAEFLGQLWHHLGLVGASVAIALLLSCPLVALALARERWRGALFAGLGVVQTIPSIALFGALIAPLSALAAKAPALAALGVGGTGVAPAVIALTLYSLGPLVRSFVTGLREAPADVTDAARGLGFSRLALFLSVELPLALPAAISGLRVVTIQAIALAAVAALIGAGGLGVFIFRGVGQYALDLVLIGAVPIILLALAADLVFSLAGALARAAVGGRA